MKQKKLTKKKIIGINISARRWFQKTYGNTYHRVKIEITYKDQTIDRLDSGIHYGYDNMWDQNALTVFFKHFGADVPRDEHGRDIFCYLTRYAQQNKINYLANCADVPRERDLKNF